MGWNGRISFISLWEKKLIQLQLFYQIFQFSLRVMLCHSRDLNTHYRLQENLKQGLSVYMGASGWGWSLGRVWDFSSRWGSVLLSELWPLLKWSRQTPGKPSRASTSRLWRPSSTWLSFTPRGPWPCPIPWTSASSRSIVQCNISTALPPLDNVLVRFSSVLCTVAAWWRCFRFWSRRTDAVNISIDGQNLIRTRFEPTERMSTYLLAFVVSEFTYAGKTQGADDVSVIIHHISQLPVEIGLRHLYSALYHYYYNHCTVWVFSWHVVLNIPLKRTMNFNISNHSALRNTLLLKTTSTSNPWFFCFFYYDQGQWLDIISARCGLIFIDTSPQPGW